MNDKLKAAIAQGQTERQEELAALAATKESLEERRHRDEGTRVHQEFDRLLRDDWIYKQVQKAVSNGEDCLHLSGTRATALAINRITGLHAVYEERYEHINSDEVKELLISITVRWNV